MRKWLGVALGGAVLAVGCVHTVKVEPIQVQPIHITMDIYLRVDRELDSFFGFQQEVEQKLEQEEPPAAGEQAGAEQEGGGR
jgi:hypothetical protein